MPPTTPLRLSWGFFHDSAGRELGRDGGKENAIAVMAAGRPQALQDQARARGLHPACRAGTPTNAPWGPLAAVGSRLAMPVCGCFWPSGVGLQQIRRPVRWWPPPRSIRPRVAPDRCQAEDHQPGRLPRTLQRQHLAFHQEHGQLHQLLAPGATAEHCLLAAQLLLFPFGAAQMDAAELLSGILLQITPPPLP